MRGDEANKALGTDAFLDHPAVSHNIDRSPCQIRRLLGPRIHDHGHLIGRLLGQGGETPDDLLGAAAGHDEGYVDVAQKIVEQVLIERRSTSRTSRD